jgi:hypothetical protein
METVTIGCKLPHGYILEIGYQVEAQAADGKTYTSLKKIEGKYKAVRLNGWHDASGATAALKAGIQPPPSMLNPTCGITKDVPADFWAEWRKSHADLWAKFSKAGILFEAKSESEAAAKAIDSNSPKVRTGLEPLDPRKLPVPGISKADFTEAA